MERDPAARYASAADLAHHADYDIKVSANLGRGGLSFGWNGPHRVTISNLPMPGGCTAATGYSTGCGVRFRFTSAAGSLTVAAGGDLHLVGFGAETDDVVGQNNFSLWHNKLD